MYSNDDPLRGLDRTEKLILSLRKLFSSYGYSRYRMSKFEEYDFYSRNKEFLVSEGVITFTDTDGKLMALKPDVTLSIIKNCTDRPGVRKLFYDENVYRVARRSEPFREIRQAGLECIGEIDPYCVSEVLFLASRSLDSVSHGFVLDISHLGVITAFIDRVSADESVKTRLLRCVADKNVHGIDDICNEYGIPSENSDPLKKLVSLYGEPERVIAALPGICGGIDIGAELSELKSAVAIFKNSDTERNIRIDFSAVSDPEYYSGIVFKGYINGVPGSVLSGGCYDTLMNKLGKNAKAIGFALYLDMLGRLYPNDNAYDADVMLVYGECADHPALRDAANSLVERGYRVFCAARPDDQIKCRFVCTFKDGKVNGIEQLS